MGLLDKLKERFAPPPQQPPVHRAPTARAPQDPDEAAIDRYRYMLRTAPPDAVEQAHAEAFAKLTPEQRQKVLADLSATVPESERATSAEPQALARMATRAEMRRPGTMERTLGGGRGGPGMGGMIAGTLLASVAGAFIGTAIADAMFDDEPPVEEDVAAEPPMEEPVDEGGFDGGFDEGGFGEF
ncbi:MAG: hypothetical protein AB7J32_26275 [Pseudonocardia sp.]